jgi:hypothetical protein
MNKCDQHLATFYEGDILSFLFNFFIVFAKRQVMSKPEEGLFIRPIWLPVDPGLEPEGLPSARVLSANLH